MIGTDAEFNEVGQLFVCPNPLQSSIENVAKVLKDYLVKASMGSKANAEDQTWQ